MSNTTAEPRLKYVALHLTYVCGNKCPYCYVGDGEREKHPPFNGVKKVIRKLGESGIEKILLVGGDPCVYPHLRKTVEFIKELNFECCILSNTLEFGENLNFFLNNIDDFQTTILGSSSEEHDGEARNKGAYDTLIKNLTVLTQKGKEITVAISLHKLNFDKVFEIVRNLIDRERIRVKELVIQRVIPSGRAVNTLSFSLDKEQVATTFKQLDKIKNNYDVSIDFEDPFPLCIVPKNYRYLQKKSCEWGFSKGSVNFNGGLSRCGADSRFSLGNILEIDNLQLFWEDNQVLVDFRGRKWLPGKCQKCELLERCGGGCSLSRITNNDHECDALCHFC